MHGTKTDDPKHQVTLRSSMSLAAHLQIDASLRWVDTLQFQNGFAAGELPSYFELDTRIGWVLKRLELAARWAEPAACPPSGIWIPGSHAHADPA